MGAVTIAMLAKSVGIKCDLSTTRTKQVIDTLVDEINLMLDEGEIVRLSGLGSLRAKLVEAKFRPAFGKTIYVRGRRRIVFRGVYKKQL
jgi:nucleoid DNA-binding protein